MDSSETANPVLRDILVCEFLSLQKDLSGDTTMCAADKHPGLWDSEVQPWVCDKPKFMLY